MPKMKIMRMSLVTVQRYHIGGIHNNHEHIGL